MRLTCRSFFACCWLLRLFAVLAVQLTAGFGRSSSAGLACRMLCDGGGVGDRTAAVVERRVSTVEFVELFVSDIRRAVDDPLGLGLVKESPDA